MIPRKIGFKKKRAFSLVEVVLSMSVLSIACLSLMGLLGTGLETFRQAIGTTVQAQIAQAVINGSETQTYNANYSTNIYFSDEGTVVAQTDPNQLYTANVTAVPATIPLSAGSSSQIAGTIAVQLQVKVVNKSNPTSTNTFYLVWPNT